MKLCHVAGCFALVAQAAVASEALYNGIQLSEPWPPADRPLTREPMRIPYLENRPEVIPIDVGRQLFVDDFLIESTNLTRTYHRAAYYEGNPVLTPDTPWERLGDSQKHPAPTAMVFSDGVWYDPQDELFKMWYMAGYVKATCYATSKDGIHWTKPELDVVPGTNIVHAMGRDSGTVWLDHRESDPQRRFKMFLHPYPENSGKLVVYYSGDGIHWGNSVGETGPLGDRSTVFYNPFRNVWVQSIRAYDPKTIGRYRRYSEHADAVESGKWTTENERPFWIGADKNDSIRRELNTPCELYNLDAVAYESLLIGLFSIWRGQPAERAKPNEICVGFSRDGFHWQRPSYEPFIPVSENYGDWNWGNVQSAGGCCLIVGDKLYFYVSGRGGVKGSPASGVSSTGLATLRRDGFASMDAGDAPATLTTRPIRFQGKHLFVNVDADEGEIKAELLTADGEPMSGFTVEDGVAVSVDRTATLLRWKGGEDISALAGKPIKVRFHVRNARLYAFWVSPDASGASHGYVAAGGPGLNGPRDTTGMARAVD